MSVITSTHGTAVITYWSHSRAPSGLRMNCWAAEQPTRGHPSFVVSSNILTARLIPTIPPVVQGGEALRFLKTGLGLIDGHDGIAPLGEEHGISPFSDLATKHPCSAFSSSVRALSASPAAGMVSVAYVVYRVNCETPSTRSNIPSTRQLRSLQSNFEARAIARNVRIKQSATYRGPARVSRPWTSNIRVDGKRGGPIAFC